MPRQSGGDNTAYPLTDLMTSLMVIFILLLLVFLNNQASTRQAPSTAVAAMSGEFKKNLGVPPQDVNVARESGEFYIVTIDTPIRFPAGQYRLNTADDRFIQEEFPKLAEIVCSSKYRDLIEELNVEGQSDGTLFRGASQEDSLNQNLQLSQQRAMEVVKQSLLPLAGNADARACLADKLTAGGRSHSEPEADPESGRRVQFKIKMRSELAMSALLRNAAAGSARVPAGTAATPPEVLKVLDLFRRLRMEPRESVAFRLSQGELNTYLQYAILTNPRPGIESIQVKLYARNYISTLVRLDLDELGRNGGAGILAPLHPILNGKKEIWLDVRFEVKQGLLTFTVEKAFYQNTHLPAAFVRQLIRLAASLQPEHFDTSAPLPLPFHLRQLRTENGILIGEN